MIIVQNQASHEVERARNHKVRRRRIKMIVCRAQETGISIQQWVLLLLAVHKALVKFAGVRWVGLSEVVEENKTHGIQSYPSLCPYVLQMLIGIAGNSNGAVQCFLEVGGIDVFLEKSVIEGIYAATASEGDVVIDLLVFDIEVTHEGKKDLADRFHILRRNGLEAVH